MGTNPTGAGSATAHHLEHIHFIQICSNEGVSGGCFGVELYFWLNNSRLSEVRRWKWLWELAQSILNIHRWAAAWSEHDNYGLNEIKTCHAQSEHVHVTHSSQLAINPRSKLEGFGVSMNEHRYKGKNGGLSPYEWLLTEKRGLLSQGFARTATLLRWGKE